MPKITKRVVDALVPSPDGKEVTVWDSEIKGFGVRMMPSGVASYFVYYRNAQGRQRKVTFARVGVTTPEEARDEARRLLSEKSKGSDPSAERRKIRQSITVADLCDLYLEKAEGRIKGSTLKVDRSRIDRHVKPLIGRISVASLTTEDVTRMQDDIAGGKTAGPRKKGRGGAATGGKGVASRTVGMFATILEYAKRNHLVKENVARGVDRPADGKQRRFLSLEEIKKLGAAMVAAKAEPESGVAAIRFLLLTGCRRMEALSLDLSSVDRSARCIRFTDTKSGYQIRPIGSAVLKLLGPSTATKGWAFPATRGDGHFVGLPKVLERLCKRAEIEPVNIHVLRHSFAAVAAEMGFSVLTIAGMLGHAVPGVTARYAHVPDSALVAAADRVSARIEAALAGQSASATVVQLHDRSHG